MITGKQLRSLRTKKNVSQKLLAQCAGFSSAYTHKLERSRVVSVTASTQYRQALEQAAVRAAEVLERKERESEAVLARFGVTTPVAPAAPAPIVQERMSVPAPIKTKTSTLTFESVTELLDSRLGKPEPRGSKHVVYMLPGQALLVLGFDHSWSVRTPSRSGWDLVDGKTLEGLITRLGLK